jgi:hypothetical protein
VFPGHALECSAIHLPASCSVIKPLITSVSPSGHRISIPQPVPGIFRAMKVGRCSIIPRICADGGPVQASHPATIKLTDYPRGGRWPALEATVLALTRTGLPLPRAAVAARGERGLPLLIKARRATSCLASRGVWEPVTSSCQKPATSPAWPSNRKNHKGRTRHGPRPGKSRI